MAAPVFLAEVGDDIPGMGAPFSVLVDADEEGWGDAAFVRRFGSKLLASGCRYFVCFGKRSELVHDLLDDVIVEEGYQGVTTTFHEDESKEEALDFLFDCAMHGMQGALIIVRNKSAWETELRLRTR